MKEELGVDAELIAGTGGVFDVIVDEEVIYSRKKSGGKFPEDGQIVTALKEML